jgi:hypothetical protein
VKGPKMSINTYKIKIYSKNPAFRRKKANPIF